MRLLRCKDYQELSTTAADWLLARIQKNPFLKIGIATGNSPLGMYRQIGKIQDLPTADLTLFQLDEWVGLSDYAHSTMHYIEKEVRFPWGVAEENIHCFSPKSGLLKNRVQAKEAAASMQNKLDTEGPLDLLILGMGKNGHLGFLEPATNWPPYTCYVSTLAPSTQRHEMIGSEKTPPKFGVTMGIRSILEAKEILFLVAGTGKSEVYAEWQKKAVTPELPASILWKHPSVLCITELQAGGIRKWT